MIETFIGPQRRQIVIERAGNCCEYCRISQTDQFFAFEIDHIIAENDGGQMLVGNLCLSCPDCNAFRRSGNAFVDREADDALTPLFDPRSEVWDDHFHVEAASGRIEAQSSVGRVTVIRLRLNDPDRIRDRKLLIDAGRYQVPKTC